MQNAGTANHRDTRLRDMLELFTRKRIGNGGKYFLRDADSFLTPSMNMNRLCVSFLKRISTGRSKRCLAGTQIDRSCRNRYERLALRSATSVELC